MDEAIVLLLALEKKCRLANDSNNLKEVCLHLVRLCRERSDWVKLNSVLAVINKRDSQNKTIIIAVTKEVLTYIDATPTNDVKIELIKALKEVVDGKIYVEGESASLHFMLSKIYESQGDIDAACDIIQDVHVETYGSLTKQQKAEYILEQMRVTLVKKDYIRAMIHSRKMNPKTLEEEGFADIKIRYYTMMVAYHAVDRNSWEVCQAYYKVSFLLCYQPVRGDIGFLTVVYPVRRTVIILTCSHFLFCRLPPRSSLHPPLLPPGPRSQRWRWPRRRAPTPRRRPSPPGSSARWRAASSSCWRPSSTTTRAT
jgi:26S proteasome regulatory subunit N5